MEKTKKYDTIFGAKDANSGNSLPGNVQQQPAPAPVTKDFEIIAAEVRAIISKAYEVDEPKNIQS